MQIANEENYFLFMSKFVLPGLPAEANRENAAIIQPQSGLCGKLTL